MAVAVSQSGNDDNVLEHFEARMSSDREAGGREFEGLLNELEKTDPKRAENLDRMMRARMTFKKFQQDNALKVDGFMRPGGLTEQKMKMQLTVNTQNQDRPQESSWNHQFGMDVGGDREFDVKGPIRIDTHNPSASLNGARYHVDWHALDEKGNVIPEFRNAGKTPEAHPGHIPPFTTLPKTFEPPYPNPNGHRVRVWYPPQAEYSNHPGRPYLNIYRQK